jgi:hypothetical protein
MIVVLETAEKRLGLVTAEAGNFVNGHSKKSSK